MFKWDDKRSIGWGKVKVGQCQSCKFGDFLFIRSQGPVCNQANKSLNASWLLGYSSFERCLSIWDCAQNLKTSFSSLKIFAEEQVNKCLDLRIRNVFKVLLIASGQTESSQALYTLINSCLLDIESIRVVQVLSTCEDGEETLHEQASAVNLAQHDMLADVREGIQTVERYLLINHVHKHWCEDIHKLETLYDVVLVWLYEAQVSDD